MVIRKIESLTDQRKKRVAAYARVSTEAEEQMESLRTQVDYYDALIRHNPMWEYVNVYADSGKSGTSAESRREFQRMIADAKAGKLDIILVKSISRFARNVADAQKYVHELKSYEVEVRFEREAICSFDPASDMVFSVLAAVAQEESRSISENVKWSYRVRAENGVRNIGGNRALGYDADKDGNLSPNGDAWIIKLIFEQFASGASISGIVRELNDRGAQRLRSKKPFCAPVVRSILANELYAGDQLIQKTAPRDYLTKRPDITEPYTSYYVTGNHEAIISRVTWELTKARLAEIKAARLEGVFKRESAHFLYGTVRCAKCGARYKRRTVGGKGNRRKVWKCAERLKGAKGNGCLNKIIAEDELLRLIANKLKWKWKGADKFNAEAFLQAVQWVDIAEESIRVFKK